MNVGPIIVGASQVVVIRSSEVVTVEPTRSIKVEADPAVVVVPPPRGAWDEKGWQKTSDGRRDVYEGHYAASDKRGALSRFRGRVTVDVLQGRVSLEIWVADPPAEIRRHPKGACFQLVKTPWFRLNWVKPAEDVDNGILYMERLLSESLALRS